MIFELIPRVVAALQPWAEISERLRRLSKFELMHYSTKALLDYVRKAILAPDVPLPLTLLPNDALMNELSY